jgi:hypothetical protein
MSKKETVEVDVILFGLDNSSDLRNEYPELADIPEFQKLKAKDVRLCWLLGNRTSPLYKLEKRQRLHKALEIIYGVRYQENEDLTPMIHGEMPEEIREGIKRMELFNPEYRLRAKLLSQYMFETLNSMVVLSDAEIVQMDIDEKKKYTDLVVKIHSELPDMVKRLEESYGVKTTDRKTKKKVMVNINDILK